MSSGTAAYKVTVCFDASGLPQANAHRFWRFDLGIQKIRGPLVSGEPKGGNADRSSWSRFPTVTSILESNELVPRLQVVRVALAPALWKGLALFQLGRQEHT